MKDTYKSFADLERNEQSGIDYEGMGKGNGLQLEIPRTVRNSLFDTHSPRLDAFVNALRQVLQARVIA